MCHARTFASFWIPIPDSVQVSTAVGVYGVHVSIAVGVSELKAVGLLMSIAVGVSTLTTLLVSLWITIGVILSILQGESSSMTIASLHQQSFTNLHRQNSTKRMEMTDSMTKKCWYQMDLAHMHTEEYYSAPDEGGTLKVRKVPAAEPDAVAKVTARLSFFSVF